MKKNVEHSHKTNECKKAISKLRFFKKIYEVGALVWTFGISSIVMLLWR